MTIKQERNQLAIAILVSLNHDNGMTLKVAEKHQIRHNHQLTQMKKLNHPREIVFD